MYIWLQRKLGFINPSEDALHDLVKEHDKDIAHLQVKLQSAFLLPLLVWLFLGNIFWAIGGLVDIFRYRAYEYLHLMSPLKEDLKYEDAFQIMQVLDGIIVGLYLISALCFFSGVRLVSRIIRERKAKEKYSKS